MLQIEATLGMLTAYLDESSDDRAYVVARFVARDELWTNFSTDWRTDLAAPPKISHFKMHDVFTTKTNGVFRNHPLQERIAKTESLISIINTHLPCRDDLAVNVVMDVRAYKSILEPALPRTYQNPYLWCFQGILVSCSSWIKATAAGETINFTFDDNKKEFRDALRLYQRVANLPGFVEVKKVVGTIRPGDDKAVMPLQAADLLAGQTRLYGTDKSSATFIPSIARTRRSHFSYLLGKNRLAAIRLRIEETSAWVQEFMKP